MLLQLNAVTDLNRRVARAYVDGAEAALDSLSLLAVDAYQPYHAAIALSGTDAEKAFLERKRDLLGGGLVR